MRSIIDYMGSKSVSKETMTTPQRSPHLAVLCWGAFSQTHFKACQYSIIIADVLVFNRLRCGRFKLAAAIKLVNTHSSQSPPCFCLEQRDVT